LSFCRKVTMNGRCETDPLDKAVDVCDRCYGEFCDSHLLRPKGRKHPLCGECALMASGVRGTSKIVLRGDRKTAKKRRKELLEAGSPTDSRVFEFFDQEARSAEESADQAEKDHQPSDESPGDSDDGNTRSPDVGDATQTPPKSGAQSVDETPATPAVAQLEQLRKEAEAQSDPSPDAEITPSTDSKTSSSASGNDIPAELLERRKSFGTERSTLQPDVGHDGLAPLPNRQSTRPPTAPPPERASAERASAERASAEGNAESAAAKRPASRELPPAKDRRRATPPPTHRRATAPMIGEVRNVAGRRSDDAPAETGNAEPSAGQETDAPDGALNAVDVFDADRRRASAPKTKPEITAPKTKPEITAPKAEPEISEPEISEPEITEPPQVDEAADSGRADVDSQGNWIPPVLRGIAPDATEAKADLPQRPRR
ncbi:MAG: hypothetical protein ACR2QO_15855, partial [Acidimicrobiales bacterium]